MTENTRQIDPHNPGPTVSVAMVTNSMIGIGEVIAHVLQFHEVDEKGKGDLAVLLSRVASLIDQFSMVLEGDEEFRAAVDAEAAKVAAAAEGSVPDDVWAALGEIMTEAEITEIQQTFGGDSGR